MRDVAHPPITAMAFRRSAEGDPTTAIEAGAHATFSRASAALALLSVLFFIVVVLGVGSDEFSNAFNDIGEMVAALIAAAACATAARRLGPDGAGWRLLALSSLAWAAGEAVWTYYDLVRGIEEPFPSIADVGFLGAVPLAIVGLRELFPTIGRWRQSIMHSLFEGLFLGSCVAGAVWIAVLLRSLGPSGLPERLVGLAYPVGDLIMLAVVWSAGQRGAGNRTTKRLIFAGLLCFAAADASFSYLTSVGRYALGSNLDMGWVLGYFGIALAALWDSDPDRSSPSSDEPTREVRRTPVAAMQRAGPRSGPLILDDGAGLHVLYERPHLTRMSADRLVHSGVVLLMAVDVGLVLYDLMRIVAAIR